MGKTERIKIALTVRDEAVLAPRAASAAGHGVS